jgi:two-component system sensor histidine kinase UhpB
MDIKDDGKGFDLINERKGNGLNNMQKRAEQAGGTLIIESNPGGGTGISFSCPIG